MTQYKIKFINDISATVSTYNKVYIDLSHRCNMECNNCYLPNRTYPDADYNKILEFIDQFPIRTEFRLIGGEPTLHKHLPEIISFITSHPLNHRCTLVTNGLKLASPKYTKLLKRSGLDNIYLSMNGFDEDSIYENIDNMKCAKLKMKSLNNILHNNIKLVIGCIVIRGINEHIPSKMKEFFNNNRKRVVFEFRNIGDVGRNMVASTGINNFSYEELLSLIMNTFKFDSTALIEQDEYNSLFSIDRFKIRINNWSKLPLGFSKVVNESRGRMTENYKVAPFLEHIVVNAGEY